MTEVLAGASRAHTRTAFCLTPLARFLLSVALVAPVLAVKTSAAQLLGRFLRRPLLLKLIAAAAATMPTPYIPD